MCEGIGGYFELELPNRGGFLHDDGVLLNSGRNALEYVLRSLPDIKHLWIPYYTCDVILEPIRKLDIAFTFYRINEKLEIGDSVDLHAGDYLLYTNYFGIKDQYVQQLADKYGFGLIIDNAQAWFADPIPGISTIYSPRKYVGVPDGGIAYCRFGIDTYQFEQDSSYDRCSHLLKRIDSGPSEGYAAFKDNNRLLANQPIRRMSRLTQRILKSIDFESIKEKRIDNFLFLDEKLGKSNLFSVSEQTSFSCPMFYPYLTDKDDLKASLIRNGIFVATYWPSVLSLPSDLDLEIGITKRMLAIPCDQRYGESELERIIETIRDYWIC